MSEVVASTLHDRHLVVSCALDENSLAALVGVVPPLDVSSITCCPLATRSFFDVKH